jgi:CBS-domain-containing membrane protein
MQTCKMNDSLQTAENIMGAAQIHRLPVVDDDGKLRGIVSLGDLAQHVHRAGRRPNGLSYESVARTLAAITQSPSGNGMATTQAHPGTGSA